MEEEKKVELKPIEQPKLDGMVKPEPPKPVELPKAELPKMPEVVKSVEPPKTFEVPKAPEVAKTVEDSKVVEKVKPLEPPKRPEKKVELTKEEAPKKVNNVKPLEPPKRPEKTVEPVKLAPEVKTDANVEEVKVERKGRSTKSKVITVLLGISLFCVLSILLLIILD